MPAFGWESTFWVAGLPLFALPLMYKQLPETASYLIKTGKKEQLFATLTKVNPGMTFNKNDEVMKLQAPESKVPVLGLFKEKRALSTVMFWIAFICNCLQ